MAQARFSRNLIVDMDPNDLVDHKLNAEVFARLPDKKYDEVKRSISDSGINTPLQVRKIDSGVYQVICGHQRKKIAMEIGLKEVPCIIRDDLSEEWMVEELLIRDNLDRRQLDDPGVARACEYLLRIEVLKAKQRMSEGGKTKGVENLPPLETGKSRDKVASVLGVSGRQLDKIRAVDTNAPEEIKKQWEGGEISTNKAYDMMKKEVIEKEDNGSVFNRTNDNIEWAIWTWNPVTGCKHGCTYCYARDIATRFYKEGFKPTFHEKRLSAPGNTKISTKDKDVPGNHNVFVCSMADLFGEWVPKEWIDKVLKAVNDYPEWNFLFLTKNPGRLLKFKFPKNSWVGTTVDVQSRVKKAEEVFKKLNATVKFISCEPLRENVVFKDISVFDWLIIGGQSKCSQEEARQPEWMWVDSLLAQARSKKVKVYFKPNLTVRPREYPELVKK